MLLYTSCKFYKHMPGHYYTDKFNYGQCGKKRYGNNCKLTVLPTPQYDLVSTAVSWLETKG